MQKILQFDSRLHKNIVAILEFINACAGIRIFGQLLKLFLFCASENTVLNTIEAVGNPTSYDATEYGQFLRLSWRRMEMNISHIERSRNV